MPSLPGIIRARREQAGFTRTDFAAAIGKSYSTVIAYERGDVEPPLHVIQRIACVLDVPLSALLDGEVVA